MNTLPISLVNDCLAHKQHLPTSHSRDVIKVVRDIVALHATIHTQLTMTEWQYGRQDHSVATRM